MLTINEISCGVHRVWGLQLRNPCKSVHSESELQNTASISLLHDGYQEKSILRIFMHR